MRKNALFLHQIRARTTDNAVMIVQFCHSFVCHVFYGRGYDILNFKHKLSGLLTALKVINFARALARAQILSRISASYSSDQELSCAGMRIFVQQKMWKRAEWLFRHFRCSKNHNGAFPHLLELYEYPHTTRKLLISRVRCTNAR